MRAAESINDLITGRPRELNDGTGRFVIDLHPGHRLVFCANHPTNPASDSGNLDWSRVSRVKIVNIEGCND